MLAKGFGIYNKKAVALAWGRWCGYHPSNWTGKPLMLLPITALYAALLVAVMVWLGWGIGSMRGKTGISIGHGDSKALAEAGRRHGNFTEHGPMALVLMAIVELNGGHGVFLHIVGALLVLCRIAHPLGLHYDNISHPLRTIGAGGTLLLTVVLGAFAIWQGLSAI